MKSVVLGLAFVLASGSPAFATWSVIALDAGTGQAIIASATCVRQGGFPQRQPNGSRDLMDVQAVIVPGLGVAACQAGVDNTRENQMLVYNELKKGTPPSQIIDLLKAQEVARKPEDQMERRQFGILANAQRRGRSAARNNRAGFNGSGNSVPPSTSAEVGRSVHQVQGNTLLGDQGVHMAALAFTRATGTMADRVMAAMEAADQGTAAIAAATAATTHWTPCPATARPRMSPTSRLRRRPTRPASRTTTGKYFAYISVTDDNTQKGESGNPGEDAAACATTPGRRLAPGGRHRRGRRHYKPPTR